MKKRSKDVSLEQSVEKSSNRLKQLANKHQIAYTFINFFVLMVMFAGITMTIFGFSHLSYVADVEENMSNSAQLLKEYDALPSDSNLIPIDAHVLYYDKDGYFMKGYGNAEHLGRYLPRADDLNKFYMSVIENKKFRIYTTQVKDGNFVKIAVNIDTNDAIFNKLIKSLAIYAPIASICLFGVSLVLAFAQIKPYQRALDSSLTFTSNVAHELNTPLCIVKSNIENILADDVDGEFSTQLATCLSEMGRLRRLTGQLLLLSRSDNNRMVYILQPQNIKELITDIVEPYNMMAEEQGKTFNIYLSPNLDVEYSIDKDMYHQIIVALLDNAIKYTKEGEKISVHAKVQRNKFYLTVSDNGVGVAESELEKIFVRFYRSDKSRTTTGTGLGLPIVHAIVSSLGGKIVANNLAPCGFAVSISVPIKAVDVEDAEITDDTKPIKLKM